MYKVKNINSIKRKKAVELMRMYGLSEYYTINEILTLWDAISDEMGELWLTPSKDLVEELFGVELEERRAVGVVEMKPDDQSND